MNILGILNLGGESHDFYLGAFSKAWEKLGHTVYRMRHDEMNMSVARSIQYYPTKVDFVFHSYNSIPLECVDAICEGGTTTVLYIYDEPFEYGKTSKESPHYNISFNGTYRQNIVDHNRLGANMYFLPQAVDPDIYHPVNLSDSDREKYGADVSFIGTLDERRKDRENLEELLKGFNYKLWGPGTTGWIGPEECNKIYSASKIIFNPPAAASLSPSDTSRNDIVGEHTCRVYNTAAARAFQLVPKRSYSWGPFIEGEEIISYESNVVLPDYIKVCLAEDEMRNKVATRGYLRVLRDHTFINRAQAIIRYVELYKVGRLPRWEE